MTLGKTLLLTMSTIFTLMILTVVIYHGTLVVARDGFSTVTGRDVAVALDAADVGFYMLQCRRNEKDFLMSKNEEHVASHTKSLSQMKQSAEKIGAVARREGMAELAERAAELGRLSDEYDQAFAAVVADARYAKQTRDRVAALRERVSDPAAQQRLDNYLRCFNALVAQDELITASTSLTREKVHLIEPLVEQTRTEATTAMAAEVDSLERSMQRNAWLALALGVFSLLVGSSLASFSGRSLTWRIRQAIRGIDEGTLLVSSAAAQVAQSSQDLAESASSQAANVEEVSRAAKEQRQGIEQVNSSISTIDKLTQGNTSTSEESASASEELSSQSRDLREMVELLTTIAGQSARVEG